jgi:hypothetical protein
MNRPLLLPLKGLGTRFLHPGQRFEVVETEFLRTDPGIFLKNSMKAETLRDFRYQLAELKIKW